MQINTHWRWEVLHAMCMCLAIVLSVWTSTLWPVISTGGVSILIYAIAVILWPRRLQPFVQLTPSLVTLARLLLIGMVFLLLPSIPSLLLAILLVAGLLLDGVDGALARRFNVCSAEGALLDVESDAAFVCLLALALYHFRDFSALLVAVAALRYVYVLGISRLKNAEQPEPRRRYASVIAVLTIVSMVAALVIEHWIIDGLVYAHCVLVIGSFVRSFGFRLRAHAEV